MILGRAKPECRKPTIRAPLLVEPRSMGLPARGPPCAGGEEHCQGCQPQVHPGLLGGVPAQAAVEGCTRPRTGTSVQC